MIDIMDSGSNGRNDVKTWKPDWKARLRVKCLERVRLNRSKVLWDNRLAGTTASTGTSKNESVGSIFKQIVADELQKSKQQAATSPLQTESNKMAVKGSGAVHDMLWEYESPSSITELGDKEYEELMLAMERALYEDMHESLEGRDAALAAEYETVHAIEDESLNAVVEQWQNHELPVIKGARHAEVIEFFSAFMLPEFVVGALRTLVNVSVHGADSKDQNGAWQEQGGGLLCPLCKTRQLQQSKGSIYCGCGRFQIDIHADQIGLDFLQKRLAEVVEEHVDSGCHGQGDFFVQHRFGIAALYIHCAACDYFQLVL